VRIGAAAGLAVILAVLWLATVASAAPASVAPAAAASGRSLKALLGAQPVDEDWPAELAELRAALEPQERRWSA